MVDFDAEFAKRTEGRRLADQNTTDADSDRATRWAMAREELADVCRSAATKLESLGVPPVPRVDVSSDPRGRVEVRLVQMEKLWPIGPSLGLGLSGSLYHPFTVNAAISAIRSHRAADARRGLFVTSTAQRLARIGIGPDDDYVRVATPVLMPAAPPRHGAIQFIDTRIDFVDMDSRQSLVDLIINETVTLCAGR